MEVLVALTLGGILATVLLQLMQGNGRYVAAQSAREEVQQNGRASVELIAGDLRGLPSSAIRSMGANSIRFYLPRAWGVLCNQVGTTTTTVYAIFPAGAFPADFQGGASHWGIALEQVADPATANGQYAYVTRAQQAAAGSQCNAVQPNAGNAARYLVTAFTVPGSLVDTGVMGPGGTIRPGTQLMVFEEMSYDVSLSSGAVPGRWIRRMAGYAGATRNMQPMAGPLPADTSMVFRYLRDDGVTAAAVPAEVRRVRLWLEVQSRAQRRRDGVLRPEQVDTLTTDIILRNR